MSQQHSVQTRVTAFSLAFWAMEWPAGEGQCADEAMGAEQLVVECRLLRGRSAVHPFELGVMTGARENTLLDVAHIETALDTLVPCVASEVPSAAGHCFVWAAALELAPESHFFWTHQARP